MAGNYKRLEIQCDCDYCKQKARKNMIKGVGEFVAGAVVTSLLVEGAILAAPFLLGAAGFASAGIRAGSLAARAHSWIGNVRKASVMARLMSMGAKGALSPGVISAARSIAQIIYAGGSALSNLVDTDKDGNMIFPEDPYELQNLQNELILRGLLCPRCLKPINERTAGRCTSVCSCFQYGYRR